MCIYERHLLKGMGALEKCPTPDTEWRAVAVAGDNPAHNAAATQADPYFTISYIYTLLNISIFHKVYPIAPLKYLANIYYL